MVLLNTRDFQPRHLTRRKFVERVAIDRYFELQNKVNKGGSLQGVSVKQVYEKWLKTKSL